MFTVIIAEKDFFQKMHTYESFLRPFTEKEEVAFCEWNEDGDSFAKMLPSLTETVGRREKWRALIVCGEQGIAKRNPFDLVQHMPSQYQGVRYGNEEDGKDTDYEAFLEGEHQKKMMCYEEASTFPLTRLVTYLCQDPTVTSAESELVESVEFRHYLSEAQKKQQLRDSIRGSERLLVSLPSEIICVAKRTCPDLTADFHTVWDKQEEENYSRFYDRNLYFEKMRFLCFDILPREHQNYVFDYLRFIYGLIVLASNEVPSGCLNANRVYRLDCENDETALRRLLFNHEAKIKATIEGLNQKILDLQAKKPLRLSDREADAIFGEKASIPVTVDQDYEQADLYVGKEGFGLDISPSRDEEVLWNGRFVGSKRMFLRLMKRSRRSLKRAASEVRMEDNISVRGVEYLNDFQIEDTLERIANEELAMVDSAPPNMEDDSNYVKQLDQEDRTAKKEIPKYKFYWSTYVVGLIAVLLYALGFFTLFITNRHSNLFNGTTSAILMLVFTGIVFFAGVGLAVVLRFLLLRVIKNYNRTVDDICNDITLGLSKCSSYLGHICNIRRGYKVLHAAQKKENPDQATIILYRKHILDMEKARMEMREVFGRFLDGAKIPAGLNAGVYEYNFDIFGEHEYPLPFSDGCVKTIEFLQPGVKAQVPVDFVKSIKVRREELYD